MSASLHHDLSTSLLVDRQPKQDGVREEMGEQQEEEGGNQLQGKEEEVHQSEQQEVQHVLQQQMEDMQIEQSSVKQDGDLSLVIFVVIWLR